MLEGFVDYLPMAKPVVQLIYWGSAADWTLS